VLGVRVYLPADGSASQTALTKGASETTAGMPLHPGENGLEDFEGHPTLGLASVYCGMTKKKREPNQKLQAWIDARTRHRLSHSQVQMPRELGMNPEKLGKLDNHKQEAWKMPLRQYIEHLYLKRFGKSCPDAVMSIEERSVSVRRRKQPGVRPNSISPRRYHEAILHGRGHPVAQRRAL